MVVIIDKTPKIKLLKIIQIKKTFFNSLPKSEIGNQQIIFVIIIMLIKIVFLIECFFKAVFN